MVAMVVKADLEADSTVVAVVVDSVAVVVDLIVVEVDLDVDFKFFFNIFQNFCADLIKTPIRLACILY